MMMITKANRLLKHIRYDNPGSMNSPSSLPDLIDAFKTSKSGGEATHKYIIKPPVTCSYAVLVKMHSVYTIDE